MRRGDLTTDEEGERFLRAFRSLGLHGGPVDLEAAEREWLQGRIRALTGELEELRSRLHDLECRREGGGRPISLR